MKKASHQANIVRIQEVLPHNNADTLELIHIGGYQCVVKKGSFKPGSLAVYIQPDSVVPQTEPFRFIWEGHQTDPVGETPLRKRRISVRKFRGEWSEGLLMPYDELMASLHPYVGGKETVLQYFKFGDAEDGDDVSDLLGITHYDPDAGAETTKGDNISGPSKRRYPRTIKGWFFFMLWTLGLYDRNNTENVSFDLPIFDVEALKNYKAAFQPGEPVVVTEKIHGSNARFVFLDGKMYAGSRTLWKSPKSNCIWRKALAQNPGIEEWCRANEGWALYGEVTPTQKGFNYGCADGEVKFFVFDIRTPDGQWLPYLDACMSGAGLSSVPLLYTGPFDIERIKSLVDGQSQVPGVKHIREGVVVKPLKELHVRGLGRLILKIVSNAFLEKDSK